MNQSNTNPEKKDINTKKKLYSDMNPKTIRISYWIITVLFSVAMLGSGISELQQGEEAKQALIHLGYPVYLNIILGVAKIIGVITLLQWKFNTIKEWAYAGFTIDFIGASASMYFAGDGILTALSPVIFIAVMFISYFLWKKTDKVQKKG